MDNPLGKLSEAESLADTGLSRDPGITDRLGCIFFGPVVTYEVHDGMERRLSNDEIGREDDTDGMLKPKRRPG